MLNDAKIEHTLGLAKATTQKDLAPEKQIQKWIDENKIIIFTKSTCGDCKKVREKFDEWDINLADYIVIELDFLENGDKYHDALIEISG